MSVDGLVSAWEAWDRWSTVTAQAPWRYRKGAQPPPQDAAISRRLTLEVRAHADRLGVSLMALRDCISGGRRDGLPVRQAVCCCVEGA